MTHRVKAMTFGELLRLRGREAKDKITDYTGVVTAVSFDLYGCVQAVITPGVDDKGNLSKEGFFYDVSRLEMTKRARVMEPVIIDMLQPAEELMALLGKPMQDRVTGFVGIAATVVFAVIGDVSISLSPPVDEEGKHRRGKFFDSRRLKLLEDKSVMDPPDFAGIRGPDEPVDTGRGPADKEGYFEM